jgi:hypothetical protein
VLPDGFFSNQKSQFGQILEGLATEDVGVFCGHLVNFQPIWYVYILCGHLINFQSIWYILWPFGNFSVHLVPIFGGYLGYFVVIW